METAYITTPIYYPSGKPHIGSAYTSIACDVYARFQRLMGKDTFFLTGTDEHGLKILRKAEEQGQTPQNYLDGIVVHFKNLSSILNLSNNDFIRTTEERHKQTVQALWQRMVDKGFIYKDTYAGWYSVSDETFYTEEELVDGKSPDSGHPVEWTEEESYFFKLSAFQQQLLDYYTQNPNFIMPKARRNEVIAFVKSGLKDLSVSRSTFNWGVPVPNDPKHVMYVWIDALTNYLSALGWPNGEKMKYWPAIHVVGKDILRFHAVYWPAFLMAADVPLPKQVYAHGWWTVEGRKMSKSYGNVIMPEDVVEKYGRDQVRYFLMREIPFGNDGDWSEQRLTERINGDLANALGNLFQRVLAMVAKNCDGFPPAHQALSAEDLPFVQAVEALPQKVIPLMDSLQFHAALQEIWEVISKANQYMDAQKPWMLKTENPQKMYHVLRVLLESFRTIAVLLEAFMPESVAKLKTQIGIPQQTVATLPNSFFALDESQKLPTPEGVFMRLQNTQAA